MADRLSLGIGLIGLALTALLAPGTPPPLPLELRWLAAYLLFVVAPGWLLVRLLLPSRAHADCADSALETILLALAAGYSLAVLLGLVLHALFQPIAPWQIAAGGGLLVLTLALAAARRGPTTLPWDPGIPTAPRPPLHRGGEGESLRPLSRVRERGPGGAGSIGSRAEGVLKGAGRFRSLAVILLVLAVAAPLRLADLGWSEFQGDEARVVLRAMAALQGADGALAAHRKVPGEILLAYLFAGSLGQIVEQVARLPFAIAGVGAVLAFFVLARRLLDSRPAALAAGLLLAVNGYFVAFGRILQYDSLAFFLGIAGLLCCWRFGQTTGNPDGDASGHTTTHAPAAWAFLGALLLSGAALVALGAVFLMPPALFLAWSGIVQHARTWRHPLSWRVAVAWVWPIAPMLLAAGLVLGAGDPADGPSGIWSYLGPRLGGDRPYWHGALLFQSANHYLSTPYLLVLLGAGALAVLLGLLDVARTRGTRGTRGIVIRLAVAVLLAALSWDRPRAAVAIGAVLALAFVLRAPGLGSPSTLAMRVALAWAAGPLFVHLLLIRVPGTHVREAFPGLILVLAALAAPALARRRSRLVVGALLAVLILGVGHYAWVTLVQRLPEYQVSYPANRHPLDWTDRDGRGIGGVFGAVHRHGWKALGVLAAEGSLSGGYATNESPAIAAWYLRHPQGCQGTLTYVFRVQRAPHDRNLALPVPLPSGYQTRGQVRVHGRPTILLQVPPARTERLGDFPAEAFEDRFDRELGSVWRPVGELYRADLGAASARRACTTRNRPPHPSANAAIVSAARSEPK